MNSKNEGAFLEKETKLKNRKYLSATSWLIHLNDQWIFVSKNHLNLLFVKRIFAKIRFSKDKKGKKKFEKEQKFSLIAFHSIKRCIWHLKMSKWVLNLHCLSLHHSHRSDIFFFSLIFTQSWQLLFTKDKKRLENNDKFNE